MAKYKYSARTEAGELQAGYVEAANQEAALNILKGNNLFILALTATGGSGWYERIIGFFGRVKIKDLMIFTRQFSILLEARVPLSDTLRTLHRQTEKAVLRNALLEVSEDVDAGLSLSQAMERQREIFSEFYISMIRPAELTGRLEKAMSFLADYLEKEALWISRIRNALIYPSVVLCLFAVVMIVMLVTVFPQIEPVFKDSGVSLPLITTIFLLFGNFIIRWWLAIIIILILFGILAADYLSSVEGKLVLNEVKIRLPVLGGLFKKIYVARFAESLSILIRGGIPMTQGLEISSHAVQNAAYSEMLHEVAEGVARGELLSSLLTEREYYFPVVVSQLVAVGESAGRVDEVLTKISSLYTREVNDILDSLVELIQPFLIVVIGAFIGLLFASILIPIYNLARAF